MLKTIKWSARRFAGVAAWIAAFAAGALLDLAFAPYRQMWVAPLSLAGLYLLLSAAEARQAFARGFWFGMGLFAFGVPWVYLTLTRFGGMPAPLAALAWALFISILAIYIGLVCAVFVRLRSGDGLDPWLFAALWAVGEWVRGVFLTGFPWLDVGYAASLPPLMGLAPLVGVLGLSFLVTVFGTLAVEALRGRRRGLWWLVLVVAATPALATLSFVHRVGRPLTVSLIQGDVSPYAKWNPRARHAVIARYLGLTRRSDGRLVIWPETASPGVFASAASPFHSLHEALGASGP